ncbi:MAG: hypothetical protein ACJAX4_002663 [Clostridium sp.]|jgi:hypothetical protein
MVRKKIKRIKKIKDLKSKDNPELKEFRIIILIGIFAMENEMMQQ